MKNDHNSGTRRMLYEDNLFREAVKEAARIEGESLLRENEKLGPTDAGVSIEKQTEFRSRLKKELQYKKGRQRRAFRIKMWQRVAVIVLVLGTALVVSLFSVDAFRVKLFNFLMETRPEYTEFHLEEEERNSDKIVDWPNAYIPTYVPEGYSVESAEKGDDFQYIILKNSDGKMITFAQYSEASSFNYNTEDAALQDIKVNEESGTSVVKDDDYSIIWKYKNLIFVVKTQINEQETLKIAESIKFIK